MIILVILGLIAAVLAYVGYPLWASSSKRPARGVAGVASKSAGSRLVRDTAIPDTEELELDREAGRLDAQEYAALVEGAKTSGDSLLPAEDDEIERRVRALRQERARRRSRPKNKNQERR